MNTPQTPINAACEPQPQDESHDGLECQTPLSFNRLLVIVEGDSLTIKALVEKLMALQCPIGDEGDGLTWIEVPSRYCYFVFAGVKLLGDQWMRHTSQTELDAEAASANRIVIAPHCREMDADLVLDQFKSANVSIKTVSVPSLDHEQASAVANVSPDDHDPLSELLKVIADFGEQEKLLVHVGGY